MTFAGCAGHCFNLLETQGPLMASTGRNAVKLGAALVEKKFAEAFLSLQPLAVDAKRLVEAVRAEFAGPVPFVVGGTFGDEGVPLAVADAEPVMGLGWFPGRRLFTRYIRHRVRQELRTKGFISVGGSGVPLSEDRVHELLAHIDDAQILEAGQVVGGLGDGTILERLRELVQWIVDHQEEILAVVKFILTLLMLFI